MGYEIYGPLVGITDVEAAITSTIQYWVDAYLAAVENAAGEAIGTTGRPASYAATFDDENWGDGQLPAIAIVCNGTTGTPDYLGDGAIGSVFEVDVYAIVTEPTEAAARVTASRYQTALGALLVQRRSLKAAGDTPFAKDLRFGSWRLALPDQDNRTLVAASTTVSVFVEPMLDRFAGPAVPPDGLPPSLPTVTQIDISVTANP